MPHLQDRAKLFLDDMEVQKPKTIYDKKKLIPRIEIYIIEYI